MPSNSPTTDRRPYLPEPADIQSSSQVRRWWGTSTGAPLSLDQYNGVRVKAPVYTGGEFVGGVHVAFLPVMVAVNHVMRAHDYVPVQPGCWGGNRRRVTGGTAWSTHAFLCSFDLSAPTNPMATQFRSDMPPAMVADLLDIRTTTGHRVLSWGGYWDRTPDPMHFQANVEPSALYRGVVARGELFTAGQLDPVPASKPAPTPVLGMGSKDAQVTEIQRLLVLTGLLPANGVDGAWGPQTEAAVRDWQGRLGLVADGLWGPITERRTREWLAANGHGAAPAPLQALTPAQTEAVVWRSYARSLGRSPDAPGFAYWSQRVATGEINEQALDALLAASGEGRSVAVARAERRVKELSEAVTAVYVERFGVEPSAAELSVGMVRLGAVVDGLWT